MSWTSPILLAQAVVESPAAPLTKVNPNAYSTLINYSMLLMLLPGTLVIVGLVYVLINSPMGSPVFRRLADSAFKRKNYLKAAQLYTKLHDLQVLMEGNVYARKAALSLELGGNLREAQRWYEKADDWAKVGQLMLEAGHRVQAIEVFKAHDLPARLALCYEQGNDHVNAGEVYELQLNNLRKAEQHYKKAAASTDRETYLQAKLRLARVYHQLKRAEDSQIALDEVSREISSSAQYQEFPELLALHRSVEQLLQQDSIQE